jgi:hypothetical protein
MLSHGREQIVAEHHETVRVQDRAKMPRTYREELERSRWKLLRQELVNP